MTWNPFRRKEEPAPEPVEIVQSGICRVGAYLHLVHPDMNDRGIKLVSIPADLNLRFSQARIEWNAVQFELSKYPTSLRPRRRKAVPASPMSDSEVSE